MCELNEALLIKLFERCLAHRKYYIKDGYSYDGWDVFIFMYIREKIKPVQQAYDFVNRIAYNSTKICFEFLKVDLKNVPFFLKYKCTK